MSAEAKKQAIEYGMELTVWSGPYLHRHHITVLILLQILRPLREGFDKNIGLIGILSDMTSSDRKKAINITVGILVLVVIAVYVVTVLSRL